MKALSFDHLEFQPQLLNVRNNREDLIRQIVEKTDTKNPKHLAKRIALVANQFHWTETDLHFLLKKHGQVKNYSAFINWSLKVDTRV